MFLTAVSFVALFIFLFLVSTRLNESLQPAWLLIFDIFAPVIVSVIVLFFQPFFVLARKIILFRAGKKMDNIKSVSPLKVIAITGSYGKTSTKEFLTTILSKKYKVLSTSQHQNSEMGVAQCILNNLGISHQVFIAEVGAYNKGKVKEVCTILKPDIGIVTGVNEQHLSLFGSLENLLSAEGGRELASFVENDGLLVVNGDNKYCLDLAKRFSAGGGSAHDANGRMKIYSEGNKTLNSDIWSDDITVHKNFISFVAIDKSGELAHFNVKVLGEHNVQNLLGAIIVAKELGMDFGEISEACNDIKQEQGGMVLKKDSNGINIINSSYSANPDGVLADLNYLNGFEQKKVIVMPSLIELGKKSAEIHKKIGNKIGQICDKAIITSKDKFAELKNGAKEAGMEDSRILFSDNPDDIYSMITLFCKAGDAVLLEGRVHGELIKLLMK